MGRRRAPAPPQLQAATLTASRFVPLKETFDRFTGQQAQIPQLQEFADLVNRQYQSTLEGATPGLLGQTRQVTNIVSQLLEGGVPADVQAQIQRQSAQQAMAIGAPATSQLARNITSRDLGLTSLELQQAGVSAVPGVMQMAQALTPQQVQNYLFSTGQIRGEQLSREQEIANIANQNAVNRTNVANQNAVNRYNYDVQRAKESGGFLGTIGGLVGGIAGSFIAPGIGTALGASIGGGIGSAIGGGGFQLGAGQAGGLIPDIAGVGSSLFGGGLLGRGGGITGMPGLGMGSGLGASGVSSFSIPVNSFSSPITNSNWPYNQIGRTPAETFGGRGFGGF